MNNQEKLSKKEKNMYKMFFSVICKKAYVHELFHYISII